MDDTYTPGRTIRRDIHDDIMEKATLQKEELLFQYLYPGTRVLDIGCGPGSIARQIALHINPGGEVIGLDNNASTLRRAVCSAPFQGGSNVSFLQSNAYALPFCNQEFDIVYCRHLLMHLVDSDLALSEAMRVTRKGGHVIVRDGDFDNWVFYPTYPAWERLFNLVRRNLGAATIGRQLWTLFHNDRFTDVRMRGIPVVITGDAFQKHVLSWLQIFQSSRNFLLAKYECSKDILDQGVGEGELLLGEPFGMFSCLEYEIVGERGGSSC